LRKKKKAVEAMSSDEGSIGNDSNDFHSSTESESDKESTDERGGNKKERKDLGARKDEQTLQSLAVKKVRASNLLFCPIVIE
jgi:hypothetical protein